MEGAWFLGDCSRVLKGNLAIHRKIREQGGWLKSLGIFGKGLIGPLDKSKWAGRRNQTEVQKGRREERGEGWDGVGMSPLQPEEGYLPLSNPTVMVAHSLLSSQGKETMEGEPLSPKDPWIYLPTLHPQEKQIPMSPPMLSFAFK